jgi:hypothetical protein
VKRLGFAALLVLLLALIVAGCGGGGTTTVIEKTVTVGGEEGASGENGAAGEAEAKQEEREQVAKVEAEEGVQETAEIEAEEEEKAAEAEETGQLEDQIEAPSMIVHLQTFRSPSGNIGCAMFEGGARCDIRKREWSPPPHPASCSEEVDFGQGLNVAHDGKASFVCAGDTTLDPSAKVLAYGEASELGGTICMSRSAGITCANHAGHGFFISIQSYKIF